MRSSPMDIGKKSVLSKVTQKGMYIRVYTKCSVRFTQLRMVRFRFHCIRNNNWLTYLHKYSTAACMQSMRSAKCVQHCTTTTNRFDVHTKLISIQSPENKSYGIIRLVFTWRSFAFCQLLDENVIRTAECLYENENKK